MFNGNPWEVVLIGIIFLVVFGPEQVPEIDIQLGRMYREIRGAADAAGLELSRELEAAAREAQQAEADEKAAARQARLDRDAPPPPVAPTGAPGGDGDAEASPEAPATGDMEARR